MHGLQVMYIKKEGEPRQGRDILTRWWLFLLDVPLKTFYLLLLPDTKKYVSSSLFYLHTCIHYLQIKYTLTQSLLLAYLLYKIAFYLSLPPSLSLLCVFLPLSLLFSFPSSPSSPIRSPLSLSLIPSSSSQISSPSLVLLLPVLLVLVQLQALLPPSAQGREKRDHWLMKGRLHRCSSSTHRRHRDHPRRVVVIIMLILLLVCLCGEIAGGWVSGS